VARLSGLPVPKRSHGEGAKTDPSASNLVFALLLLNWTSPTLQHREFLPNRLAVDTMPREQKKRGRRIDEKNEERKRRRDEDVERKSSKRLKSTQNSEDPTLPDIMVNGNAGDDFISFGEKPALDVTEFHGLLSAEEQEYYANVNHKLTANDFESDEDRNLFIDAVYRESQGKELKLASSQSCSRYLEKIVLISTPEQLAALLGQFLGNLTYLVQHRFGSHCCEALFLQAARHVGVTGHGSGQDEKSADNMEELFLKAVTELEPNAGYLLTDRFASHTIRVLFLVLSGEPLDDASLKVMLASKKKENLQSALIADTEAPQGRRSVPKSFTNALSKLIRAAISSLDTTYLRALATHPTGNPVLQLLLRLELSVSDKVKYLEEDSLFRKLFPELSFEEESESAKFVAGLMYDPTGSHLIEILAQNVAGKTFKKLYKNIFKQRICSMAKNDTASYVAIRILERLGKDDLAEAKALILPEIPKMIARHRPGLVKVLVERCNVRQVGMLDVADVLRSAYGDEKSLFLPNMLNFMLTTRSAGPKQEPDTEDSVPAAETKGADVHGSLLAQAMLQGPALASLIQESLLALDADVLVDMAKQPAASRVIQAALTAPTATMPFRRQFIPRFFGNMAPLACDKVGSYVADALWTATEGLHFMKERLAKELANHETQVRESLYGRNVWRNWLMDLYQRRFHDWRAQAKGYDHPKSTHETQQGSDQGRSPLQLARERYANHKARDGQQPTRLAAASVNA